MPFERNVTINANLREQLKQLLLSGLLQTLEVRLQEAKCSTLYYAEFLELILEDEMVVRSDRKIERRTKAAAFRDQKCQDDFYFDFNKFDVKSEFHNTVSAYGNYLAVMKEYKILVEGNADERGTVEYNLALGQKRAEAVSIALQAIGANANNIEAISNGEEKPRNKAKSEAAFAENRRADLIVR